MKGFINPQLKLEQLIVNLFDHNIENSGDVNVALLSGFLRAATNKLSALDFKKRLYGQEIHELIKRLTHFTFDVGSLFYDLHCFNPDLFPISYNKNYILRSLVNNGRFSIPHTSFNLLLNDPDVCNEIVSSGNEVLQLVAEKGDFSVLQEFLKCGAVVTFLCHSNGLNPTQLMQAAVKGQSVEIVEALLKIDTIRKGIIHNVDSILDNARKVAQTNRVKGTKILALIQKAIDEQKRMDSIPVSLRSIQSSSTASTSLQSAVSTSGGEKRSPESLDDDNTLDDNAAAAIVTNFVASKVNAGQPSIQSSSNRASTSSTSAVSTKRRLADEEIEQLQSDNEKLKLENEMMRNLFAQDQNAKTLGMQPNKRPR